MLSCISHHWLHTHLCIIKAAAAYVSHKTLQGLEISLNQKAVFVEADNDYFIKLGESIFFFFFCIVLVAYSV